MRYRGKPFLRLLDSYVLWTIGQLPAGQRLQLEAIQGKLATAYGVSGPWYAIVAGVMHFPREIPEAVRNLWSMYRREMAAAGEPVDPVAFAHSFVDKNWVPPPETTD